MAEGMVDENTLAEIVHPLVNICELCETMSKITINCKIKRKTDMFSLVWCD